MNVNALEAMKQAQPVTKLKRGTTGNCTRSVCICERDGLGDECIWLEPARPVTDEPALREFGSAIDAAMAAQEKT